MKSEPDKTVLPASVPSEKTDWNPLTPAEKAIIVQCGTEPPFSGAFWNHHEAGTYVCKRCNAPLFPSTAKFDSGTGWPSFDDAVPGALRLLPDPDRNRTEIRCANCDAHLGHVFRNEGFTEKQTRHCVNSISLAFVPADKSAQIKKAEQPVGENEQTERAIFAGGCFWGVEYQFERVSGVKSVRSGYTGGHTAHPTYREVCSGTTGHAEAIEVVYDPDKVRYETLCRLFFEIHDPTQLDRQGPDYGKQYRSEVFYLNDTQKETALRLIDILKTQGLKVVTRCTKAETFWPAEDYHQDYYAKTGGTPYCHIRVQRFRDNPGNQDGSGKPEMPAPIRTAPNPSGK